MSEFYDFELEIDENVPNTDILYEPLYEPLYKPLYKPLYDEPTQKNKQCEAKKIYRKQLNAQELYNLIKLRRLPFEKIHNIQSELKGAYYKFIILNGLKEK